MNHISSFYSGTSNILLPIKQSQFPEDFKGASRLAYYASLHSSLEVNASFYKVPKAATVEKWKESVPALFRFTFKVPKAVTHARDLQFNGKDLDVFTEAVAGANDKKGCLLVQLPPSIKREMQEEVEGILESLHSDAKGWKIAVEFRNTSWYTREVYRMLQNFGAGMVEQDMPKSATPPVTVANDFHYLRFHGPDGNYRESYSIPFLAGQAKRIAAWLRDGREVYAYFNDTMGDALGNLATLDSLVIGELVEKR